ncbi:Acg family FMN-binding oxidoreductase [Capnocytophaga stomatis]|uniref:Acg family FMN-binding oxidoreductase n=1 Tax=Capnocytophaga stomatis TaxID=1848904 RepID=A0ABW8QC74_9FLAO
MRTLAIYFCLILIGGMMKSNAQNSDYMRMIEYAIKAPSGHNTQPWLFEMTDNQIIIHPNFDKHLAAVDGDNRELFISLGCATENLCLAASALSYQPNVSVSPQGIITVHLEKSELVEKDLLFDQIETRQTNRSVYNKKEIPEEELKSILQCFEEEGNGAIYVWKNKTSEFDLLCQFVMKGNEIQMNDEAFKQELLSWIRFNKRHSEKTNDGISYAALGAPNLPLFITKPIVKASLSSKKQNKTDAKKIASSSHIVLLTSTENTVVSWVKTGRILQRFLLLLTQKGIAHAYLNQPCEIPELRQKMQKELPIKGEIPQILLRIGYAKSLPYSKRKSVEEVIKK